MFKKILFPCILFLLLAAAAGPQVVSAGVDPLASPTPRPTERITAPVISGVNPDAVLSEGILEDSLPSGSFIPNGISLPVQVDPPTYVEINSQSDKQDHSYHYLSRNIADINCGPAALAQALKILDPDGQSQPPTTSQLSDFMVSQGLIYDWGTGVEELAFTARKYGYKGSVPLQNWSLPQLENYLRDAKPVVVSLGKNGLNKPGHFVTLTGISEDGRWITYQDPSSGESILSREEFQHLWQMQGNTGMIPQIEVSTTLVDPMLPWMGLFGVVSALALTLNQSTGLRESRLFSILRKQLDNPRRKGIGAGPIPPKEPEVIRIPKYESKIVYRGIKTVEVEVPVYETRKVKVGIREIKKKVPQYETRRVLVGVETVTRRVPVYKTKKIKTGTRKVKKEIPVTRYKTKKVMVWRKYSKRVPVYRNVGTKRFVVGYKNETSWKKEPVLKKIPYQTSKAIFVEVPVYSDKKVISGYKTVTEKVPKYEQKKILVGHKVIQESVPAYEDRQVQIGTKTVSRQMPDYETVRVVAGYKEIPKHEEKSLNEVEQKMKSICNEEKLNELAKGRDFEVTDVVYLKGGPGAGYGIEKVENSWSKFPGGGSGGSTPWMLAFKLVSRALVLVRDSTKILEGPNRKPDAQAIIMYSGNEDQWKADEIIVSNKGNEPIEIKFINIKNYYPEESKTVYSEIYSHLNVNEPKSRKDPIAPGDFKLYPIAHIINLDSQSDKTLLIQIVTPSNRSGFLIHELSINKK